MLDHDVKSSDKELMVEPTVYCIYSNAANTLDIASVRSIASLIRIICLAMR